MDAHLVIVGDRHERRNLIELAEEEGVEEYVSFTGFVEDEELPAAYAASDVSAASQFGLTPRYSPASVWMLTPATRRACRLRKHRAV